MVWAGWGVGFFLGVLGFGLFRDLPLFWCFVQAPVSEALRLEPIEEPESNQKAMLIPCFWQLDKWDVLWGHPHEKHYFEHVACIATYRSSASACQASGASRCVPWAGSGSEGPIQHRVEIGNA